MWPIFSTHSPLFAAFTHTHTHTGNATAPCRVMPCSIRDCRAYQDSVRLAGWLACQESICLDVIPCVVRSAWLYSHAGFLSPSSLTLSPPLSYRSQVFSTPAARHRTCMNCGPLPVVVLWMQYHVNTFEGLLVARSFDAPCLLRGTSIGRERA